MHRSSSRFASFFLRRGLDNQFSLFILAGVAAPLNAQTLDSTGVAALPPRTCRIAGNANSRRVGRAAVCDAGD